MATKGAADWAWAQLFFSAPDHLWSSLVKISTSSLTPGGYLLLSLILWGFLFRHRLSGCQEDVEPFP